jgi:hypothetical protein
LFNTAILLALVDVADLASAEQVTLDPRAHHFLLRPARKYWELAKRYASVR